MRNPERIDDFCERLAKAWKENIPDWRFGQFMVNMFGEWYSDTHRDPFFPEDKEMIEYIEKYTKLKKPWGRG